MVVDEVVRDVGEFEAIAATALEEAVTYIFLFEDDECLWESVGEECKLGMVIEEEFFCLEVMWL